MRFWNLVINGKASSAREKEAVQRRADCVRDLGRSRPTYKHKFPQGTYALISIKSLLQDKSVTAWELKVDVVDAFGKTIQSMTKQGAHLNLGDEQFQLDFRYDPNAVAIRVSLERAAFSDGTTWTRGPEHRGVTRTITKTPSGTAESTDLDTPVDLPKEAAEPQPAMVREQPAPAPAQLIAPENENDTLEVNKTLPMKAALVSKNGRFQLVIQDDGNLVVSRRQDGRPIWDASAAGSTANQLLLQGNGNLILQRGDGTVAWSTNTAGKQGVKLICQVDGNLVLYTQGDVAVWASGSNE